MEERLAPATVTWINPLGGLWHIGSNWDTGAPPGPADDAVIPDQTGNVAITHSQGTSTVRSLTSAEAIIVTAGTLQLNAPGVDSALAATLNLSGSGRITGSGNLLIAGRFTWNGGTMDGTGRTDANGGILFNGTTVTLGRTLRNAGTAVMTGPSGSLSLAAGAVFTNLAGATFDIRNDQSVTGASGTFNNEAAATLRRSLSNGTATVGTRFNNAGAVEVRAGTLTLSGGGNHNGTFTGLARTTLAFAGGAHDLQAPSSVSVPNVRLSFGTLNVNGIYDVAASTTVSGGGLTVNPIATLTSVGGNLTVSAGTADFRSGEGLTPATFVLSGSGTLTGTDNVTVSGLFSWLGGSMTGTGTTSSGGTMELGGTSKTLGRNLDNTGTAILSGADSSINLVSRAVIRNTSGGVFEIRNDRGITGADGTFSNQKATVRRTSSIGTATIGCVFNNSGTVEVQAGTLNLAGGGNHEGTFTGAARTRLQFGGGNHDVQISATVTVPNVVFGGGTVNVNGVYEVSDSTTANGGTVTFNPAATVNNIGDSVEITARTVVFGSGDALTMSRLTLSGGSTVLTGTDDLTVNVLFSWTGGTMSGTGTTTVVAVLDLSSSAKTLGRTLNNAGAAVLEDPGSSITFIAGAVFNNLAAATFDVRNDQGFSGSGTFNNQADATVLRSLSIGTATLGVVFNNSGAVSVQSGTLNLSGGGNHSGSFTAAARTRLRFGGGTHDLQAASTLTSPIVVFDGGVVVSVNGTYNVSDSTTVAGFNTAITFNPSAILEAVGTSLVIDERGTLNLSSGEAVAVTTLDMASGSTSFAPTLTGSDNVTVSGTLFWSSGTVSGTGTLTVNGGIEFGGFQVTLGRTLRNGGTATLFGPNGALSLFSGAIVENLAGALFDMHNDQGVTGSGTFTNQAGATLRRSVSMGTATIGVFLNNSGAVQVQSGTLNLNGGGNHSGSFTVAAVAALEFSGGTHDLQAASSVTGPFVRFGGGTVNVNGTYNVTGTTVVDGGQTTVTFNASATLTSLGTTLEMSGSQVTLNLNSGEAVTVAILILEGNATLTGSDSHTVSDVFWWAGGTLGGTGTTTTAGALELVGTSMVLARTLTNTGTATWTGGSWSAASGAVFNNQAGAFFVALTDQTFSSSSCSAVFNNRGTFRKIESYGVTMVSLNFVDTGTLDIQTGTLNRPCGSAPGSRLRAGLVEPVWMDVSALLPAEARSVVRPDGGSVAPVQDGQPVERDAFFSALAAAARPETGAVIGAADGPAVPFLDEFVFDSSIVEL